MGLYLDKLSDNNVSLIVSLLGDKNTADYFAGDSISAAIEYFGIIIEGNQLRMPDDKEKALNTIGVVNSTEAKEYAEKAFALAAALSDEQALNNIVLFPLWSEKSVSYAVGDRVRHNSRLYKVIQAHTSQADWYPEAVPALFSVISIAEWQSGVSYAKDAKMTYQGKTYVSLIDNNVWSPTDYPAGWQEVK